MKKKVLLSTTLGITLFATNTYGQVQQPTFELRNNSKDNIYMLIGPAHILLPIEMGKLTNLTVVGPKKMVRKSLNINQKNVLIISEKQKPQTNDIIKLYEFKKGKTLYLNIQKGRLMIPQKAKNKLKVSESGFSLKNNTTSKGITKTKLLLIAPDQKIEKPAHPISPPTSLEQTHMQEIVKALDIQTSEEALRKINDLLEELESDTIDEAIETAKQMDKLIGMTVLYSTNALQGVYRTIANVLNSRKIEQILAQVPKDEPEQLIQAKILRDLNQLTYDQIFELKKRYFEAIKIIKEFSEPLIKRLQEIMSARDRGASQETILSLIPPSLPSVPRLEDMPENELMEQIKKLSVEEKRPAG